MNKSTYKILVDSSLIILAITTFVGAGFRVFAPNENISKRLDEKTLLYIGASAFLLRFREVTSFEATKDGIKLQLQTLMGKIDIVNEATKINTEKVEEVRSATLAFEVANDAKYFKDNGVNNPERLLVNEEEIKPGKTQDDPWKGQFDGKRFSRHRELSADVRKASNSSKYFYVKLRVESTNQKDYPLAGNVKFYLHPTFSQSQVSIPVVNGVAEINLRAWGAFTVGAITEDKTKLELDLSELEDLSLSDFVRM